MKKKIFYATALFMIASVLILTSCGGGSKDDKTKQDSIKADSIKKTNKDIPQKDSTAYNGQLLIPSPGEILDALDKLSSTKVNWGSLVTYPAASNYSEKFTKALNLGVRISDAFVALYSKNSSKLGQMTEAINNLAADLGFMKTVKTESDSLKIYSANENYAAFTKTLNRMNAKLQDKIEELGDKDVVLATSIGGFFEGMQVVSGHLKSNYVSENTSLLLQSKLAEKYLKDMDDYGTSFKKTTLGTLVYKNLNDLNALVKDKKALTAEEVGKVNALCTTVHGQIIK